MECVKGILERHTIVVQNAALRHGFTQIPNNVLRDARLSFGARLTYTMLLSYAWQEGSCFPGQGRIAADLGVTRKSISQYLIELRESKYIDWLRRGLGRTNVYYMLDIEADVTPRLHQDVTQRLHPVVTPGLHKEYSDEKDPEE